MNKYTPTIKELEQVYEALEKSLLITEDPQLLSVSKELLWVGLKRAFEVGREFEADTQKDIDELTEFERRGGEFHEI